MDFFPAWVIQGLGFAAATLPTVSFAPQVARTRRKGGGDLSWTMLLLFGTGVSLWLVYGLCLSSWPVVLANAVTAAQVAMIAFFKKRHKSAELR